MRRFGPLSHAAEWTYRRFAIDRPVPYFSSRKTGQDRWVIEEIFGKKKRGYFVDVGAHNGVKGSNSYALEKYLYWDGICIEPCRGAFARMAQVRRCHCDDSVVAADFGEVDFYPNERAAKIIADVRSYVPDNPAVAVERRKAAPLAAILEKYNAPKTIDYLSLDTEGSEFAILSRFPFGRYQFRAVTVEHHRDTALRAKLRGLLEANEYIFIRASLDPRRPEKLGIDDFYLHRSLA